MTCLRLVCLMVGSEKLAHHVSHNTKLLEVFSPPPCVLASVSLRIPAGIQLAVALATLSNFKRILTCNAGRSLTLLCATRIMPCYHELASFRSKS